MVKRYEVSSADIYAENGTFQFDFEDGYQIMVLASDYDALLAQQKPPTRTWTREKPTKPGLYLWCKFPSTTVHLGRAFFDEGMLLIQFEGSRPQMAEAWGGLYLGPLDSPPQE